MKSGRETVNSSGFTRRTTASDVARIAGVSRSAVSRTFTPGASVSPATRKKVEKAARELGYAPNRLARSLNKGNSNIIGMAIGYMDNKFYPALIESVSHRLAACGKSILLFAAEADQNNDLRIEDILAYQVDGILLASAPLSSQLAEDCSARGLPIVMVNRRTEEQICTSVTGDNYNGGEEIGKFLAQNGRTRLAFMSGIEDSSTNKEREWGFLTGLQSAGRTLYARVCGNYNWTDAVDATRELMKLNPIPDAIFCANDHMAIATMEVIRHEFGLIPGVDLDIVGFDNVDIAALPSISLTTYSQPVEKMADIAVARLLEENTISETIRVPGELIVRGSTQRHRAST